MYVYRNKTYNGYGDDMAKKKIVNTPAERDKYMKIGLNIAYYRKISGMTQEELAERVGLSRQLIGNLEAPGVLQKPSLDTLFRIAEALDVEEHKLLTFRD